MWKQRSAAPFINGLRHTYMYVGLPKKYISGTQGLSGIRRAAIIACFSCFSSDIEGSSGGKGLEGKWPVSGWRVSDDWMSSWEVHCPICREHSIDINFKGIRGSRLPQLGPQNASVFQMSACFHWSVSGTMESSISLFGFFTKWQTFIIIIIVHKTVS